MIDKFDRLMELFSKMDIPCVDKPDSVDGTFSFSVEGRRNSIICYRVWGSDDWIVVNAWFGKSDSDSGGLATQGLLMGEEPLSEMLKLHKRFIESGRLKILRRFERKGYK